MKLLLTTILLAGSAAVAAQRSAGMYDYIQHPPASDSVCAKDLRKAERDITAGQLHLVYFADPKASTPRYMQELRQLGEELKMPVVIYSGSSFIVQGQRRGCYAYRMDAEISARFGERFSDSIRAVADLRYKALHLADTLPAHTCDVKARPENDPAFDPLHYIVRVPGDLFQEIEKSAEILKPHLVLECIVDTRGRLVRAELTNELPQTNVPGALAGDLLRITREQLLQAGPWLPSRLGDHAVASRVYIGVYFEAQ